MKFGYSERPQTNLNSEDYSWESFDETQKKKQHRTPEKPKSEAEQNQHVLDRLQFYGSYDIGIMNQNQDKLAVFTYNKDGRITGMEIWQVSGDTIYNVEIIKGGSIWQKLESNEIYGEGRSLQPADHVARKVLENLRKYKDAYGDYIPVRWRSGHSGGGTELHKDTRLPTSKRDN